MTSERDVLRMTSSEVAEFLDAGRRVQVASTNADGTIHLVPLSYFLSDGRIVVWTDPASQKVANLRARPGVTCLVEAGDEFAEFRAVQVVGQASISTDLDASRRAGEALFGRYSPTPLGDDAKGYVAMLASQRAVVTITPDRVISWDHRKLAGVRPETVGR